MTPARQPGLRRSSHTLDLRSGAVAKPAPSPRRPAAKPARAPQRPVAAPTKPVRQAAPARRSFWRTVGELAQYPLIAIAALAAAYSTAFGQWIVLGFVIIAIATRRRSRLSFGAALFLLITIPVFQLLGQTGIAENVAVYVYELLVFGVAQSIWEQLKPRAKAA